MVLLRTLGGLTLFDGADRPIAVPPKPLGLLAYLAGARPRGPQRRDVLLTLFYPEADAHHGRMALRHLLLEVRMAAGANVLQAFDREQLRLNADVVDCDLWQLEAAIASHDVERAAGIYAGPFLEGFHLTGSPAFEDWLSAERSRLRRVYADTIERLAVVATERGDLDTAVARWRQLVECEPYASRATVGLMQAVAAIGDLGGALEAAAAHAERCREDLDAAPAADVEALVEQLRAGSATALMYSGLSRIAESVTASAPDLSVASRGDSRHRWRRFAATLVTAVSLVWGAGYAAAWFVATGRPGTLIGAGVFEPGDRVLLADFTNLTGDSSIGDAVREGLRAMLNEPRLVRLVDPGGERNVLVRMGLSPGDRLGDAIAREAAEREQAKAFLVGQVSRLGTGYQITVRAVRTTDEVVLLVERVTARDDNEVIPALDRLGRQLRRNLGESLRRVRAAPPLPRVSTASLSALRAFAMASRLAGEFKPGSISLLENAIELDSGFASAYVLLGAVLGNAGRAAEARDAHARAFALRSRLPERERLLVEAVHYHRPGSFDRAERAWRRVLTLDPDNPLALNYLSDLRLQQRRWSEAESLAARAIERGATSGAYWNVIEAVMVLGRFAAAESVLARVPGRREQVRINVLLGRRDWDRAARYLDSLGDGYRWDRVTLAVVRGRLAEGLRQSPPAIGRRLWWQLILARYTSDTTRAARNIGTVLDDTKRAWDTTAANRRPYPILIVALAEVGRLEEARRALAEWRADSTDPRLACDTSRAVGAIARAEGNLERAADAFLEWYRAPFCAGTHVVNRGLYEAGVAYDLAGRGDTAIALYEHALALHSLDGLTYEATWYPLVLRRLGELHQARGERGRAMEYYRLFVELWKDADPGLQPQVTAVARRMRIDAQ